MNDHEVARHFEEAIHAADDDHIDVQKQSRTAQTMKVLRERSQLGPSTFGNASRQFQRRYWQALNLAANTFGIVCETHHVEITCEVPSHHGVQTIDIVAVAVVTLGVIVLVVALYRSFLFATFDPEVAQVSGVRVALVEALLMAMLSLTILVTMRVIGTLLISALLVIPASVARMLTNSFAKMLWIAPTVGGVSAFVGMFLAFHFDTSASATIILVGTVLFICVYAFSGIRGRSRIAGIHSH